MKARNRWLLIVLALMGLSIFVHGTMIIVAIQQPVSLINEAPVEDDSP